VREVITRRLDRLSAACLRALIIAAVIGREFSLAALSRVSELAGDPLLEVLEEAETARGITVAAPAAGRYRFSDAPNRESLYEERPATRRVRLHRQVGEALEALYAPSPERYLAELAHHFYQAAPGGEAGKAVAYARQAAARATALLAYEDAVAHYQRALQ